MKHSRILIAVALPVLAIVMLALASCNDNQNKIPFNRDKAKMHIISWNTADSMRSSFQSGTDALNALLAGDTTQFLQGFQLPIAEAFNRDAIIALLNAEGAEGVRIYMGRDSGLVKVVLVPVDKQGKDIKTNLLYGKKPATQRAAGQADGDDPDGDLGGDLDGGFQAVEVGQRCPTFCDHP
jgi:hypothetical protein